MLLSVAKLVDTTCFCIECTFFMFYIKMNLHLVACMLVILQMFVGVFERMIRSNVTHKFAVAAVTCTPPLTKENLQVLRL
jgi:hypothetical protein